MTHQRVRSAMGSLYVIAILIAVFFSSGKVVAAVAVIGALVVGMVVRFITPPVPDGDRDERRAARREARRDR